MSSPSAPAASQGHWDLTKPELIAWGERFGASCKAPLIWTANGVEHRKPLVVSLEGELGAGKTTLAQAICRGFGVTEDVTSPTFALVHRYDSGRAPVYHVDLYRLRGPEELTNIGWDDLMTEPGLVLIEWPDRAGDRLTPAVRICLSYNNEYTDRRALRLEPV